MYIKNEEGTITVFLSIVLLIIIALVATLVDGARINSANSQVRRGAQSAAQSTLANYNSELKEQYGLFALDERDTYDLASTALYYMEKSFLSDKELPEVDLITQYLNESIYQSNYYNNFFDLYDYSIDDVTVSLYYDLEENEVLKEQILEYMKYRGPKELINTFLNKLDILKKSGKTADIIKEKVEVEGSLDQIGREQKNLSETISMINSFDKTQYVHGTIENIVASIDEFNALTDDIGVLEVEIEEIEELLKGFKNDKKGLEANIRNKEKSLTSLISSKASKEKELEASPYDPDLITEISEAELQVNSLNDDIGKLEAELLEVVRIIANYNARFNTLREELNSKKDLRSDVFNTIGQSRNELLEYLEDFQLHSSNAKSAIKTLLQVSVEVQGEIEDFRTKINSDEYKENIITEARYQIQYDLQNLEGKIKGVVTSTATAQFGDSSFSLLEISDEIKNKVEGYISSLVAILNGTIPGIEKSGLKDFIDSIACPIVSNYEILKRSIDEITYLKEELDRIWWAIGNESIQETDKRFDERSTTGISTLIAMIDSYSNDIRYIEFSGKEPSEEIKSYTKDIENRDSSLLDTDESIDPNYKDKEFLQDLESESPEEVDELFDNLPSKEENNPDTLGSIIDNESPTDSQTISSALDFLINISDSIQEGAEDFRDSLYINEYILGAFRCAVEANEGKVDADYFGKYNRSAYFDNDTGNHEVEYIIIGHQNPAMNLRYTQAQIYAIRTAMNMLHVYSNPDKMQIAIKLGTLASGPLPLLSPLMTTVVVFGWSSLESLIDINMLMRGEEVPFYKISQEEWKLSLGGITSFVKDELVEGATEMVQNWAETIIDRVVDGLFYQIEDVILQLTVSVDTTAQNTFDEFEDEINKRIDTVLEIIPNDVIRGQIKTLIEPSQLISSIREEVSGLVNEAQEAANGSLDSINEQISSTIKGQINSRLNTIKDQLNEKLHTTLANNETFKSFAQNQGQDVMNKMSTKNFNVKFSYQDYLRILLLMKSENTRLRRIMDLIQLNMKTNDKDFLLEDYHTLIEVKVEASIKNLFITSGFLTDGFGAGIKTRSRIVNSVKQVY